MIRPIEIRGNKVFVFFDGDMIETNDYNLIGAAVIKIANQSNEEKYFTHKKTLDHYLEINNCRKTPERYAILKTICDFEKPFTSKELLYKMEKSFRVGKTTLYNTLKMFKECQIISSDSTQWYENTRNPILFNIKK